MDYLVILGGGESGIGAALLGKQKGYNVFVSDKSEISTNYKEVLLHNKISFEENMHTESTILNANVVVKSPGIPDTVPLIPSSAKITVPRTLNFLQCVLSFLCQFMQSGKLANW